MKNLLQKEERQKKPVSLALEKGEKRVSLNGTNFELVGDFMQAFGQSVEDQPTWPDFNTRELRVDLIQEEVD